MIDAPDEGRDRRDRVVDTIMYLVAFASGFAALVDTWELHAPWLRPVAIAFGIAGLVTAIRLAVAEARHRGIPLVVTARRMTPSATSMRRWSTSSRSEGAARGLIYGDEPKNDPKVQLIIERAEVVEARFYM